MCGRTSLDDAPAYSIKEPPTPPDAGFDPPRVSWGLLRAAYCLLNSWISFLADRASRMPINIESINRSSASPKMIPPSWFGMDGETLPDLSRSEGCSTNKSIYIRLEGRNVILRELLTVEMIDRHGVYIRHGD